MFVMMVALILVSIYLLPICKSQDIRNLQNTFGIQASYSCITSTHNTTTFHFDLKLCMISGYCYTVHSELIQQYHPFEHPYN